MNPEDADRASRNAALTLSLALPGDTVLYLLLPLHAATFGISLPEAGLLLAANRIVRVFGYRWIAHFYAGQGRRASSRPPVRSFQHSAMLPFQGSGRCSSPASSGDSPLRQ